MDCRMCKDWLWERYSGELDSDLLKLVDEHLDICETCQQELTNQADAAWFIQTYMPVLELDNAFVQATMQKISSFEAIDVFLKRVFVIGGVLVGILFVMLVVISPIFFSLLWLIGNIACTLAEKADLVIKTVPQLQILSCIIMFSILLAVLAYMRFLVMRRVA